MKIVLNINVSVLCSAFSVWVGGGMGFTAMYFSPAPPQTVGSFVSQMRKKIKPQITWLAKIDMCSSAPTAIQIPNQITDHLIHQCQTKLHFEELL